MSSLKKNFSIDKLYSDLEKYEANLNVSRNSRVRRNASGASLHRLPHQTPSYKPPIQIKALQSSHSQLGYSSVSRPNSTAFQSDAKKPTGPNRVVPTYNIENEFDEHRSALRLSYDPDHNSSKTSSVLKERNQTSSSAANFSKKKEENEFLRECSRIYGIETLDQCPVKALLAEINKRDEIYDLVCRRVGKDCTPESVREFFLGFERMRAIVQEFKRMSRLEIEDEEELYNFLRSEESGEETSSKANI